ncbi:MAG: phage minor capsid protein [Oscillospiraceae bacterium]|nr:phage minor capsid protein [Oscillospiraceae bacterium]
MLTPSYLFHATEPAEEIAERLHQDILDRIIERVMLRFHRGDKYILTATDKWNIETLQEAGYLLEDIQKEIAKATPYMQSEIAEAMEDAGVRALEYDDAIYRNAGLNPVPITQSPYLINIMQRDFEATLGEWKNFTGTLADAVQKTFIRACDTAYHQAMTGSISPAQAVREALEKVIEDGVYVDYPSGHRDTIETATARAVRTGISQASSHIQIARMDEMDVDLVLVSSHLGARPSHAEWQGKIYHVDFATPQFFGNQIIGVSRSRNTSGYPDFVTSTGYGTVTGLCGANCRHNFGPYFEGMGNPFEHYDNKENQKQYDMEQRQRTLERRIRDTKRKVMNLKTALDSETDPAEKSKWEEKYQRKAALLQKQNAAYNQHCKDNNLKRQAERVRIAKWDRSQAAKARAAAKRYSEDKK